MPSEEPKRPWEQRLQDAGTRIEEELRRLTAYLNDEIVPDVRRHGSHALRAAAEELHRLARKLDDQQAQETAARPNEPGRPPRP